MSHLSNAQVLPSRASVASSPSIGQPNGVRPASLPLQGLPTAREAEPRDPETIARTLYAELRRDGYSEQQVIALAGELLSLVTADVRSQKTG